LVCRKACLAVHPDKQMGTPNENLSKLIFMELNEVGPPSSWTGLELQLWRNALSEV
jgi:hypothetical protein